MGETSSDWTEINSPDDWEVLNEQVGDFHDGVVKDILVNQSQYVDEEHRMVFGGRPVARVIAQFQDPNSPAVELLFDEVSELTFITEDDVQPGEVTRSTTSRDTWSFRFLSCAVSAERCSYRLLGSKFLGSAPAYLASDRG